MPTIVSDSSDSKEATSGSMSINDVVTELRQTNEYLKITSDVISKDKIKANLILPFADTFTSIFSKSIASLISVPIATPAVGGTSDISAAKTANLQEWFYTSVVSNLESVNSKLDELISSLSNTKVAKEKSKDAGGGGSLGNSLKSIGVGLRLVAKGVSKFADPKVAIGAAIMVGTVAGGIAVIGQAVKYGWAGVGIKTAMAAGIGISLIGTGIGMAGKGVKNVKQALGVSLALIAIAPALTAIGLVLQNTWSGVNYKSAIAAGASIVAIGGAFKLIGNVSPGKVAKMGIAFIAFAPALTALGLGVKYGGWSDINPTAAITIPAILGALALSFKVIHKFLSPGQVAKGALSLALIGPALWLLSLGLNPMQEIAHKMTWEEYGMVNAIVASLGILFGLAGAAMPYIAGGALAFALMGPALWLFSLGVDAMNETAEKMSWENYGKINAMVTSLGLLFAGAGFLSPVIALGSLAFIGIGKGLSAFGKGISDANNVISKLNDDQIKALSDKIKLAMSSLYDAISLKQVLFLNKAGKMMQSVGRGLSLMAPGLSALKKLTKVKLDAKSIKTSVTDVVQLLSKTFANVDMSSLAGVLKFTGMVEGIAKFVVPGLKDLASLTPGDMPKVETLKMVSACYNTINDIFGGKGFLESIGPAAATFINNWNTGNAIDMIKPMVEGLKELESMTIDTAKVDASIDSIKATIGKLMNMGNVKVGGWLGDFKTSIIGGEKNMMDVIADKINNFTSKVGGDSVSTAASNLNTLFDTLTRFNDPTVKDGIAALNKLNEDFNKWKFNGKQITVNVNDSVTANMPQTISTDNSNDDKIITELTKINSSNIENSNKNAQLLQAILAALKEQKVAVSVPTIIKTPDYKNS